MAVNHIDIESTLHGAQLQQYRNALKTVITEGPLLLDKMAAMVDGTDYTHMETMFGLKTGKGAAAKTILTTVVEALQSNPPEPGSTAGNAANLANKLDEFVDWVG